MLLRRSLLAIRAGVRVGVGRYAAPLALTPVTSIHPRSFSTSNISLAKGGKNKGGKGKKAAKNDEAEPEEEIEDIDPKSILKNLESQFKSSVTLLSKKLTEVRMGKANPNIFDKLKVKVDNSYTASFTELAQTNLKGKFLNVTVFDPSNTKKIISAILASNMNLNPEEDSKNPQLLKVALPNSTQDLKNKQLKELKETADHFKTDNSNRDSLTSLRGAVMKDLKKVTGSKDIVRKLTTDIDKLYKSYSDQMTTAYKNAEKAIK